jgi:hypothetical protein
MEAQAFLITSVYRTYGMIHQPSTPHIKQQNGAIERHIQTIKNMELMLTSEKNNAREQINQQCYSVMLLHSTSV